MACHVGASRSIPCQRLTSAGKKGKDNIHTVEIYGVLGSDLTRDQDVVLYDDTLNLCWIRRRIPQTAQSFQ